MVDLIIRVAGESGEGVISTGELLTLALARASLDIYTFKTYPAEIKGGHAMYQVRAADKIILSHGDKVDTLIAFNQEAIDKQGKDLKPDGLLIYDTDACENQNGRANTYGIPMGKIASEEIGSKLTKNIVALGATAALLNLPLDKCEGLIQDKFGKKGPKVVDMNNRALHLGAQYIHDHIQGVPGRYNLQLPTRPPRLVLSGNEALCLGSVLAGLRFYAGYPITPASDIMEWLAGELPKVGGHVVQTEDEIAAIGVVLGASYAGKKAMTATSGPGLSLMIEMLGLAGAAEIPAVIVNVQRSGPSTGMPTKTEQGDLNLALYGGHGDPGRIVTALTSVEDCFFGIIRAFNYAERYQCPVIVLSDAYLGHRKASINKPDLSKVFLENRLRPGDEAMKDYKRYRLTSSGVSPMAVPGEDPCYYTATGIEHNEAGNPTYTPDNHMKMMLKRLTKMNDLAFTDGLVKSYGQENPAIGIIGWGSQEGVIREAVERAVKDGYPVGAIHPKIVHPLPDKDVAPFVRGVKKLITVDGNYSGQFARLIREKYLVPTEQLTKCDGLPFTPDEIYREITEVAKTL